MLLNINNQFILLIINYAIDSANVVFPTPGGPTKHNIFPGND